MKEYSRIPSNPEMEPHHQMVLCHIQDSRWKMQLVYFHSSIWLFYQVLPHRVRFDLGVMTMKGYSIFPKALELEPYHQMQFSLISRTVVGIGVALLQRCSRCFFIHHSDFSIRYYLTGSELTWEYSSFPKALELEPYHQMQFSLISRTVVGIGVALLQRCSRCIFIHHSDFAIRYYLTGSELTWEYSIFPKALELEPYHQMQFSLISRTVVGIGVALLQRCSRCIFIHHSDFSIRYYLTGSELTWEYSSFPKALELEPYHQMQFSLISRTVVGIGVALLQRCSRCIFIHHSDFSIRYYLTGSELTWEYSSFPKALELEPYHQMQFSLISRTVVGIGVALLQRCSRCILQLRLIGPSYWWLEDFNVGYYF